MQRFVRLYDLNLYTAWELGKRLGVQLPKELVIFAIEVEDVLTFSEKLTPQVEKAVPEVCAMVLKELEGKHKGSVLSDHILTIDQRPINP
ncbi:MAG: hypothetical protein ACOYJ1_02415 [Peptococcales bacterium]|jgi:hydrogenase maturation protease